MQGFWSLTMYDEQMFFVANPINRYSMSLRTNPKFEPDGSLVITIQNESPGQQTRSQLAARAEGQVPPDVWLCSPTERAFDSRRFLGAASGEAGGLAQHCRAAARPWWDARIGNC